MIAKLRILHGTLQDKTGQNKRPDVVIRRARFMVGSASDCSLCCRCSTVSPHHCEIRIEEQHVVVRTLSQAKGTFVNGLLVQEERVLRNGDHLRIGRLEFEVAIGEPTPIPLPEHHSDSPSGRDALAEAIRDMLVEADEGAHVSRPGHPQRRQLPLGPATMDAAKTLLSVAEAPSQSAEGRGATKAQEAASQLTSRPLTAESQWKDAADAAQEALSKLLSS